MDKSSGKRQACINIQAQEDNYCSFLNNANLFNTLPRDYGSINLTDVEIGTRVRLLDTGCGPYDNNSQPILERGGVAASNREYEAVVIGFENAMIGFDDDYDWHAKLELDNGETRLVCVTKPKSTLLDENGKRLKATGSSNFYWQEVGAVIVTSTDSDK